MVGHEAQLETRGPPTSYGGSSAEVLIVDHVICLFPMSGRSRAANSLIRDQPCSERELLTSTLYWGRGPCGSSAGEDKSTRATVNWLRY